MWNLGNEPDLFAWPESYQAGQTWVRRMVDVIRESGGAQPVTCGLHAASLFQDNGLHIDRVFAETDFGVMHSYPMYVPIARHPLDPDFVPFTCAVTAALCGKPVLMEEFGGCTVGPGEPSQVWEWQSIICTRSSSWLQRKTWLSSCARRCPGWCRSGRWVRWSGAMPTMSPSCGIARRVKSSVTSVSLAWCARMAR